MIEASKGVIGEARGCSVDDLMKSGLREGVSLRLADESYVKPEGAVSMKSELEDSEEMITELRPAREL
jgi:hypothetical protein